MGKEFRQAWGAMRLEASQCAVWIGVELEGGISEMVTGACQGCNTGATRKVVVEQLEKLRVSVMMKALTKNPDRRVRLVWSWLERDKLSTAWLLAMPGVDTSLNSDVFMEAAATLLCLPSPVCADRIGCRVGNRTVDRFGDKVGAAKMEGDVFRIKHDTIKQLIAKQLGQTHLPYQCKVFNLFAHLIPQAGLSRIERGWKRQGLMPDSMLEVTMEGGQKQIEVAELKTLSCCPSCYNMAPTLPGDREHVKAVDKRARGLMALYIGKGSKVDRDYGGVAEGEVGRVQHKLDGYVEVRGPVFGAFGEASEEVHDLVQIMAASRLYGCGSVRGRETVMGVDGGVGGAGEEVAECHSCQVPGRVPTPQDEV